MPGSDSTSIFGFDEGFATAYESLQFKAKNLSNDLIRVKLSSDPGVPYVDIDLTSSSFSTALGNGWYEVIVPLTEFVGVDTATGVLFESDNAAPNQYTFLLTDFGFNLGDGGGGPDPDPEPGPELLTNGDFEASAANKDPWINAGGVFVNNYYTVQSNDGGAVFDTNLSQVVDITQGADYVLQFRARSSVDRSFLAGIGLNGGTFTANTQSVPVTTEWQSFSYTLTAIDDIGTSESRVLFDLGTVASTVDIDDVSLTLAAGSGELLTNGDFQASAANKDPWVNAGGIATNNYYTVTANDGGMVFDTNLSQVLDITQGADYVLQFRARSSVDRSFLAGIGLNGGAFTANTQSVPVTTEWQSFSYNLTAIDDIGTSESRVLFDLGTVASTVDIDDVSLRLADGGAGGGGGGGGATLGIVPDGDFENGMLNDPPWKTFPNGGVVEISTAQANGGTYSARLLASVAAGGGPASFPILKVERLEEGNLTGGESVTVSFDAIAVNQQPGAVVFIAQLFTERSGVDTGASDEILIEPPTFLTDSWVSYSFDTTLGPDAGGGVSLLFKADCGAAPGCELDAYIDNVSIVIN